jgi:hypothetical protein
MRKAANEGFSKSSVKRFYEKQTMEAILLASDCLVKPTFRRAAASVILSIVYGLRPLAARSLQGEELIVVRTRDVWKIDLGTATGTSHDLYSREPYKMATFYAKFTEMESAPLLEVASRLWNKPPRYTIWNVDTIAPEEAMIKPLNQRLRTSRSPTTRVH